MKNGTGRIFPTWWVSNIGTFSELVPLVLVKAAFDERDKNIKELESKIKDLENKIEYMKTRYDIEEDGN